MLIWLTVAWVLGILLADQVALPPLVWALLGVLGALSAILWRASKRERLIGLLLASMALGAWRWHVAQPSIGAGDLAHRNDAGRVVVRGYVSAEPSIRDTYTQLQITAQEIQGGETWPPVRGKAVLNVPHYPRREYGDRIQVQGLLETPPVLETFDYREYLAARGVHSLIRRAQVSRLEGQLGCPFLRWMLRQKTLLRNMIESMLPQPEAGLLSGILLGLDHTLPDELAADFKRAGLTHIIVISGFNFGLIAQAVLLGSRRLLHRWRALWVVLGTVLLYMLFVGPSPPVARAALMIATFVVGQLVGRKAHAPTSLALATLIMTATNPLLLWSVSFQLSFAATLALLAVEPLLSQVATRWLLSRMDSDRARAWLGALREILIATMAAQLLTLPIIWYHFGEISIVSLLANALVLPVQPAIILFGALATLLGALWLPAGQVAAWLVWPFLRYTNLIVRALARPAWASVRAGRVSLIAVVIGVAALLALLALERRRATGDEPILHATTEANGNRRLWLFLGAPALVAFLVWAAVLALPDGRMHVYFMDVGQGDATLVQSPSGRLVLIDGGPDPLLLGARLGEILPFWQRRLDIVIATHADQDHLAGLIPTLEHYRIGRALEPPGMGGTPLSEQWHQAVALQSAAPLTATRGQQIRLKDGLTIEVLHPSQTSSRTPLQQGNNRNSLVLRATMGKFSLLLTGDVDADIEERLSLDGAPLNATVLKVAHHGAPSGASKAFLDQVDPRLAVLSVGSENNFGHPSPEVIARLEERQCQVLRTDHHGTIEVITDGEKLWIKQDRP